MQSLLRNALVLAAIIISGLQPVQASDYSHPTVNRLIAADEAPNGVVFELVHWDDATWTWAAPMIADLRAQLRARYPDIDVAIVSHGRDQFQLTRERIAEQPEAISMLYGLADDGVSLHVCGTHSEWNGVPDSAYIDIVNVSASGPAQVNDYISLGYRLIVLRKPAS